MTTPKLRPAAIAAVAVIALAGPASADPIDPAGPDIQPVAGVGVGILPNGNDLEIPSLGANIGGGVAVSLKPGLVNIVPVTRKTFVGTAPWVGIHKFRIKIDGCVGESFIRSYATLAKSNDDGDGILSWYGITKNV